MHSFVSKKSYFGSGIGYTTTMQNPEYVMTVKQYNISDLTSLNNNPVIKLWLDTSTKGHTVSGTLQVSISAILNAWLFNVT